MATRSDLRATSTDEFAYELPPGSIAQQPLRERTSSRMQVLGSGGRLHDGGVGELPGLLHRGDCLVVNDTTVGAARLRGQAGAHQIELLLVQEASPGCLRALLRPGRRLGPGTDIAGQGWFGRITGWWPAHPGGRVVHLETDPGLDLNQVGELPLPHT